MVLLAAVTLLAAACRETPAPGQVARGEGARLAGRLVLSREQAPGEWRMAAGDPANTRYSPLAEIDTTNVGSLREVWSWSTGNGRGHEAAPIVADGVMYVVLPFPNSLVALALADGRVRWRYEPAPDPASQGIAKRRRGVRTRGSRKRCARAGGRRRR